MDNRLPLITRLTLSALGEARSGRVRAATDPVAAWMLKQQADLHPYGAAQAAFTTIRARTAVVDRMLTEVALVARDQNEPLHLWSLGPGFDARWFRLVPRLADVFRSVREVEEPSLFSVKNALLENSPYAEAWAKVVRRALPPASWTIDNRRDGRSVVLMEGLAGRMNQDQLEATLERVHSACERSTVIVGLPGVGDDDATRWSITRMNHIGWKVREDARMGSRGRLILAAGGKECPGTYPLRVMRMDRRP
ncbi:MAG: hypothetical protein KC912_15670 [Proteobacteria bacterium]|nr:hypothetical protein [Pseudomonadota bacterium]